MTVDRRRLLGLLGGLGLTSTAATPALAQGGEAFRHGVASGDPLADRLIIWSRLSVADGGVRRVRWQVATDQGFKTIVRTGEIQASSAADHTLKVDVDGLKPGTTYYYRFLSGQVASPVGQGRTLPIGATKDLVMAIANCQLYPGGLFNAYEALAGLDRVDVVVHLGDYIYEYGAGPDDYGMEIGAKLNRRPEPAHEIVTLADYRQRHAQYKTDPDLQAAHARAPFICVWDDHETANDSWTGGAENHQPANEGDWNARKAVAIQAYYEWMPIREPALKDGRLDINRQFDFGDLASLFMVETRLKARSQQLTYAELTTKTLPDGRVVPDLPAFEARRQDPARELLGEAQKDWLKSGLTASRQAGRPWQILGNQVIMAEVLGPDAEAAMGKDAAAAMVASLPAEMREQVTRSMALFKMGAPYNLDSWDGYPAARERLYAAFQASGSKPIVLAGDSHAFWINELKTAKGQDVATELGVTSITSPSPGDSMTAYPLGEALAARNDQVLFCDQNAKGFTVLKLTRDAATAELHTVSTIVSKPYKHSILKRFNITPAGKVTALT
jgi:alkaline phosphatase D